MRQRWALAAALLSFSCLHGEAAPSRDSLAALMKSADSLIADYERVKWKIDSTVSPVDGGVSISASLWGREPGSRSESASVPSLHVSCKRGLGQVLFLSMSYRAANAVAGDDRAAVRWRFSGQPAQMGTWPKDLLGARFWPDEQKAFLRSLSRADTLHLEVTGDGGMGSGSATFPVAGLRDALGSHTRDCLYAN